MTSDRGERFRIEFAGSARRDLREVPPRIVPAIIEFVFADLSWQPRRVGRPLRRDLEGLWGARRGPYRLIYEIQDDQFVVLVIRIAHRADAYRPR